MTDRPDTGSKDRNEIRKRVEDILKIVFPIAVSAWMIVWLLGKINIRQMDHLISTECDFGWIVLMMVISVVSHVARGVRWGLQLRGAGLRRQPVMVESVSIFGAYALNLLFPLLGETWRCLFMARKEGAKVSTVVGTDLGDRFSDAVAIMLLFGLSLIVAHDSMVSFLDHYRLGERIVSILGDPLLWACIVSALLVFVAVCYWRRTDKWVGSMMRTASELWRSFAVMFRMKGIGKYLLLTAAIWICYYLETYVCFFAFPFTRELITQPGSAWGLVPGLVAFVFGSISIAIPSNGGLGPWNIAVTFSLTLYGVSYTEGVAFSMVVWGFKSATLVLLGLFTAAYVGWHRRHGSNRPAKA